MNTFTAFIVALGLLSVAGGDALHRVARASNPCPSTRDRAAHRNAGWKPVLLVRPETTGSSKVSFLPVRIWIDPHGKPLACYQVEIVATAGDVKLVGVEGGDSDAFNKAPYYDPRALLQGNRIILGAYSLADNLPAQRTRVATLMVRVAGTVEPQFSATLSAAATNDATRIPADVSMTVMPTSPGSIVVRAGTYAGD